MLDSATIAMALYDEAVCDKYGYDTATIACMFNPNTYDIYWNVSFDKLLDRMQKESKTVYIYKDDDENIDSVYTKVKPIANSLPFQAFHTLTLHSSYADHIRTGRYAIKPGNGALITWRHLKNGLQEPVNLTIPSVRTMDRLAGEISKRLMLDSATIAKALYDEAVCDKYGCSFIHNFLSCHLKIVSPVIRGE